MPLWRTRITSAIIVIAVLAIASTIYANHRFARLDIRHRAEALTGGNPDRGRMLFIAKGCGGCHTIKGERQATGLVGPPLTNIAERAVIAGKLANNPANLQQWISTPQSVVPGNAMPDLPMTAEETRDIAAFLYTRT
jgi:cytochrome c2